MDEASSRGVEVSEALVLVAEFLERSTPCSGAAQLLRKELLEHGLLGNVTAWTGDEFPVSVEAARFGLPEAAADLLLLQLSTAGRVAAQRRIPDSDHDGDGRLGEGRTVITAPPAWSLWWEPDPEPSDVAAVEDVMRRLSRPLNPCPLQSNASIDVNCWSRRRAA